MRYATYRDNGESYFANTRFSVVGFMQTYFVHWCESLSVTTNDAAKHTRQLYANDLPQYPLTRHCHVVLESALHYEVYNPCPHCCGHWTGSRHASHRYAQYNQNH